MAYAYSMIDDMMGGDPSQQKQNIFAQPGQSAQGNNNDVTSGQVKTDAGGDVASAPTSSTNSIPRAPTVADSSSASSAKTAQAAFKANAGKVKAPNTVQNISSKINQAQTGLQQQAADYAAKQAASRNYTLDKSVADKAVKDQDLNAQSNITGLLNRTTADQADSFTPTDVGVADVDLLNSNAGIKQLVSRGRNPTYTPNLAAFDSMLLQADPNFQKQVSDIKSQSAGLKKSVADTTQSAQAAANAAAQANLISSQEDIRNYLLGYKGNIVTAQEEAAKAANAALPQQIAAIKAKAEADLLSQQRLKAQNALDSIFGAGRASSQLAGAAVDPSKYIDYVQGYTPDQFINNDQAQQYNTINSLLGLGGTAQTAAGSLPSLYKTRDNELYNSLVEQATGARNKQDAANQAAIQKIIDQANSAALADNNRRLGLTNSYSKDLTNYENSLISGNQLAGYTPEMRVLLDQTVKNFANATPAQKLGAGNLNPKLQAMDVLTQQQADQLNALAKDTGLSTVYNSGQYAGGGPQSIYDQNALKKALQDAIKTYQSNRAQAQAYLKAHPEMMSQSPAFSPAGTLIIPNGMDDGGPRVPTNTGTPRKITVQKDSDLIVPYE